MSLSLNDTASKAENSSRSQHSSGLIQPSILIIAILGILAVIMLIFVNRLRTEQHNEFVRIEMIMDVKVHLSEFHLWLEEYLSRDSNVDIDTVFDHLRSAEKKTDAIVAGGLSERGERVLPTKDPVLREKQSVLFSLIGEFNDVARQRAANLLESGIGTPIDEHFDDLFKESLKAAEAIVVILKASDMEHDVLFKRFLWGTLLFWALVLLTAVIGLLLMEKRRVLMSLAREEAVAEVKVLRGLLPICASCKEIRDDRGRWNQLESYIDKHSEAEFTHGICPKCAKKTLKEIRESG